jgi:anti-sigma B factor antagonist
VADLLFDVRVRRVSEDAALVSVAGEIDIATAGAFRAAVAPFSTDPDVRLVVCDLSQVSFFGCAGMTVLVKTHETLTARGAWLRVVADSYPVLRPLAVTGVLDQLAVSPDVRSALD